MKHILIVFIISIFCKSQEEAFGQTPVYANAKNASSSSFLDSIAKKYKLSHRQISAFTSVDSVWYTGENSAAGFAGDKSFILLGDLLELLLTMMTRGIVYINIYCYSMQLIAKTQHT